MSSLDYSWSLFNSKSEVQIDGLNSVQIKAIVSSIAPLDLPHWMAWHEGLKEWSPVSDFTELFGHTALKKIPPTPPKSKVPKTKSKSGDPAPEMDEETTKMNPVKSYVPADGELDQVNLLIQQYSNADARNTARFEKSYPVVVRFDRVKCEAVTVNISRGGLKLDRLLPAEACGANIIVEITRRDVTLTLFCQAIPEPKQIGVCRLMISKTSDDELMRGWLLEPGKA